MLETGITGGIGCGKSQVCRLLEENGIPIIHADIIFNNEKAKQTINQIVHPHVIQYQKRKLEKLEKSGKYKYAGVEAALIFEARA